MERNDRRPSDFQPAVFEAVKLDDPTPGDAEHTARSILVILSLATCAWEESDTVWRDGRMCFSVTLQFEVSPPNSFVLSLDVTQPCQEPGSSR